VACSLGNRRYGGRSSAAALLNVRAGRLTQERRWSDMAAKKKAAKKSTAKKKGKKK